MTFTEENVDLNNNLSTGGTVLNVCFFQKLVLRTYENPDFCLAGKQILRYCVVYMLSPWQNGGKREQNASRGRKREFD